MLIIDQEKVVAQSQDFVFDELHITGGLQKKFVCVISFPVLNELGERIDTKIVRYEGDDWNIFKDKFNTWGFLYEELKSKEDLDVTVPNSVEDSFANEPTPEPVVEPTAEEPTQA